ncbi:MAG: alpha/beta hydrolase [Porticoccaceae bacterium]|nr:alpha/beta hydrolase [Pseudomonadales bacterium]MCP5171653.1 alpha/beta hydrolase [Pseudomonadales bacterium]
MIKTLNAQQFNGDEISITVAGLKLAGRQWGNPEGRPAIALHGWLDNCASFDAMAPQFGNIHLIALDLAGHGFSDFRSPDSSYNIWQDVPEIFSVADQQGWEQFALIGHSRGAIISAIAAGTLPERISKLVLIDTLGPDTVEPEQAPEQLRKATLQRLQPLKTRRYYRSSEQAIASRLAGRLALSEQAATQLATRGLSASEQGFYWHADPRLKHASDIKLGSDHAKAFLQHVQCPTLLCMGADGLRKATSQFTVPLFPLIKKCEEMVLPGGHHLHMEESADAVAKAINYFMA